ncbi:hypothetical protein PIB30_032089 [Stylosanthes scabra]|uniref:Integral membrane bound transporter domain-containing protein n=1 Tax=Stylosanthes scabra TaxID=79078 RepID=A0ABU6SCU6_9FABA|nr:hypothetical protein [Stylosanthes scabra]
MAAATNGVGKSMWQACLASAYRTALATTIVGCVTLFGPPAVKNLIERPAFSYVTVVIIISNDATLGDSFRGFWYVLLGTIQSIGPAIISLWIIGPSRFTAETIALAVALAAFVVALPGEITHFMAKRLALGQIVLVYVTAYINGAHTQPLMHPLGVAASTALGGVACIPALLLPCPRLACRKVKKKFKLLTQNTIKRVKLLTKAICEEDKASVFTSISQAKSLSTTRTELLHLITHYQNGMRWERPQIKNFRSNCLFAVEKLKEVDTTLRGMEMALMSINSFPIRMINEEMKHGLNSLMQQVILTIKETKHNLHGASLTVPELTEKNITNFLHSLQTIPTTLQDLPFYFYLFCTKLLYMKSLAEPTPLPCNSIQDKPTQRDGNPNSNSNSPPEGSNKENWANSLVTTLTSPKLMASYKCSLSLGLSIYLGLLYSKNDGYWAGLPVAVTFSPVREATFRVTNLKAQGTVLGSVYGVLISFVFRRFLVLRFLSLLPWFVFTSFLQRSQMYGPAGGTSAIIGAILILGRENFGPPKEFAITRIVETFIGLFCSIFVDILFRPKRASTCAKVELSNTFATLNESIGSLSMLHDSSKTKLEQSRRKLKGHVNRLRKFVAEAEAEPNFWFLPFHGACYNKLLGSLSRLDDVLQLGAHALKFLQQEVQRCEACWKVHVSLIEGDIGHLKELICNSMKSFEEISKLKSLGVLEKKNITSDVEMGKSTPKSSICMVSGLGDDDIEKTLGSYLQDSRSAVDHLYDDDDEQELKSQVVLSLNALGFCLSAMMKETMEIEEAFKELVQWENPYCEINLYEISCKLHSLHK